MTAGKRLGRYVLHSKIASGGMATVYLGRMRGPVGFSRVVAIKRMHKHLSEDSQFVAMFLDEASLAARIQHPNVVATVDLVAEDGELFLVMDYVRGEALSSLVKRTMTRKEKVPIPVAISIAIGALGGLHAAHEARNEGGEPLGIVHRDVSPQNILVGVDGTARIVDFGIAKAASRMQVTHTNQLKGKACYMAPEQIDPKKRATADRGIDIFAAGVVLWEMLAGERLFDHEEPIMAMNQILSGQVTPLREKNPDVSEELAAVVAHALERDRSKRFATAEDFAGALEEAAPRIATARAVGEWVKTLVADRLAEREARVKEMETSPSDAADPPTSLRETALEPSQPSMSQPSISELSLSDAESVSDGWVPFKPEPPKAPAPAPHAAPTLQLPVAQPDAPTMQLPHVQRPLLPPTPPAPAPPVFAQEPPPSAPPLAANATAIITTDPNQIGPVTGSGIVTPASLTKRQSKRLVIAAAATAVSVFAIGAVVLMARSSSRSPSDAASAASSPDRTATTSSPASEPSEQASAAPTSDVTATSATAEASIAASSAEPPSTAEPQPSGTTTTTAPRASAKPTGSARKPPPKWTPMRP